MTFDEIVANVADRLNLTSPDATTRIGKAVNVMYRRVTSSVGLQVSRRITGVLGSTAQGYATVTFTGIEKIERIIDDRSGSVIELPEMTIEEVRAMNPAASDQPKMWAVESMGPSTVTILLDALAQTVYTLKADGLQTAATLSGAQVPNFDQDFHDLLVEGVLADELRKTEKPVLAKIAKDTYDARLTELRFFIAKSHATIRQGGSANKPGVFGGAGGGSAPSGGTSYVQTGLVSYDRGAGAAPFAVVQPDAATVTNLSADKLDGKDSTVIESEAVASAADDASNVVASQVFA